MPTFSELVASMSDAAGFTSAPPAEDWLQGRTLYGGLGAAFCLVGSERQIPQLPPLRSAQFAFVGPASGEVAVRATVLRRGKSTVFVSVDLSTEAGLATRATLCYGSKRVSSLEYVALPGPVVPPPDTCPEFLVPIEGTHSFQHFDSRIARGHGLFSQAERPTFMVWMRHRDPFRLTSVAALIALADCPPPAAFVHMKGPAPLSTMTWNIDLLTDKITTTDGWWLIQTTCEKIEDGYSSQATTVWNRDGEAILACRQNIAVFA